MDRDNTNYAERAILGMCLSDKDTLIDCVSSMTESDFAGKENQLVFRALTYAIVNRKPTTLTSILEIMESQGTKDEAGGEQYLQNLLYDADDIENFKDYYALVKNKSSIRQLYSAARGISQAIEKGGIDDIPAFLVDSISKINAIGESHLAGGFKSMVQILDSTLTGIQNEYDISHQPGFDPDCPGVNTGYKDMNLLTGGFKKTEYTIIGARPSVGKTAFGINLALKAAERGTAVAFFSLEMSAESIVKRMLSNRAQLTSKAISDLGFAFGKNTNNQMDVPASIKGDSLQIANADMLRKGIMDLRNLPIYIDDNPGTTVVAIEAEIQKLQRKVPKLGLVIIDYLGLITSAGSTMSRTDNRATVVGDISRALKGIARNLKIPLVVLCQLNREAAGRIGNHEPQLSDLKDSGSIEADADVVMLIHRDDYYSDTTKSDEADSSEDGAHVDDGTDNSAFFTDKNGKRHLVSDIDPSKSVSHTIVKVAKNRNGATGNVDFAFNKAFCRFEPYSPDTEEPEVGPEGFTQ